MILPTPFGAVGCFRWAPNGLGSPQALDVLRQPRELFHGSHEVLCYPLCRGLVKHGNSQSFEG